MKVRFQYADDSIWEGPPKDAHLSPDPRPLNEGWAYEPNDEGAGGIIRMIALCDGETELRFSHQDFYYLYPVKGEPGAWGFGSGANGRRFIFRPDQYGSGPAVLIPFEVPKGSVVRVGVTVNPEDAVKFGLIATVDEKDLHPKRIIPIVEAP